MYRCVDFFVDNEILNENSESPFIKLYYTEEKKATSTSNDNGKKQESDSQFQQLLKSAPFIKYKKHILPEKKDAATTPTVKKEYIRNRFICLGKMCNFKFLKKDTKKKQPTIRFETEWTSRLDGETDLQRDVLDYKKYKNSIKKAQ
jgi:hypothetical protein